MSKNNKAIAQYRRDHGMTQKEFAARLNVTQQMLSYYENGMEPSIDFIKAFKKLTGIDLIFGKIGIAEQSEIEQLRSENELLKTIIEEQKKRLILYEQIHSKK